MKNKSSSQHKFTMEKESNGKLALFDTIETEKKERSLYWFIRSLHMLTNTYATTLTTKNFARKMLFPLCLIEHILLSPIKKT